MTKKPTHLHTDTDESEAPEVARLRGDIAGKEPVLVRDWDADSLVRAIRNRSGVQTDIIQQEFDYLEAQPAWQRQAAEPYVRVYHPPADVAAKFLSMCRLDNIPVHYFTGTDEAAVDTHEWPLVKAES